MLGIDILKLDVIPSVNVGINEVLNKDIISRTIPRATSKFNRDINLISNTNPPS